ncbi:hypothetical protein HPB48_026955 [Haemaphysalis longicornis]|uniref:CCHC-type domain-containing protein n=1 Tax=Haemaphysalis longicornis TaxID=44386 RepID=A0A9J6HDM1_HAELO|nr:hypothetical protein HPB48_026955 [Haemaphysalis longicornis]
MSLEHDFPSLEPPSARKSRAPSRNCSQSIRGSKERLQSRDASAHSAKRSPSRDRVSWADTVRCPNAMKSRDASVDRKKQQMTSKETQTIEALRKENAEMKVTILQLTREMANIRKEINNKEQPMEQTPTAPSTSEAATKELYSATEPAPKKRAIDKQANKETASDLDTRFAGIDSRLDKLEKLILAMKTTIERKFGEYDSKLAVQERNTQLITSHPIFAQQQALQAGKQLAGRPIASRLPRLPHTDHKATLRPKEGLELTKLSLVYVGGTIRLAANVHWERGKEEDQVVLNKIQGTITYSTPKKEDALKVLALKKLQFGSKVYEVATYMAAPEDCGRGVVDGIDRRITEEELEVGLSHPTNPPVLGVGRMGTSESVIITFGVSWVPRWVRILGSPIQCFLYRKKHEVCFKCGQVGHRSDVCNNEPSEKCKKCGSPPFPTGEHDCKPKCQLCGNDHETGDRRCKALYRIPYLIKKRQWKRKLDEETRKQEEENGKQRQGNGPSTSKDTQRKSRHDQSRDRGRSKSRKRSKSRNRSVSFPRLPSLRKETPNNTTNLYSASVGARETPKHSTPKVG